MVLDAKPTEWSSFVASVTSSKAGKPSSYLGHHRKLQKNSIKCANSFTVKAANRFAIVPTKIESALTVRCDSLNIKSVGSHWQKARRERRCGAVSAILGEISVNAC